MAIIKKSIVGKSTGSKPATRSTSTAVVPTTQSGSKLTAAKAAGHTAMTAKSGPSSILAGKGVVGHNVLAGKVLAGKVMAGKVMAGKVMAGKVLAGKRAV